MSAQTRVPEPGAAADRTSLQAALSLVADGHAMTAAQAEAAFRAMMAGEATPAQIGGLLMALCARGEAVEEIEGAVRAMRAYMVRVRAPAGTIDTCGTGGDGAGTFNVSTAVAFVVAGCGVPVAKHCNRSVTSRSGAADVIEALGVDLEAPAATLEKALAEAGLAFLFAPRHHGAVRHVGPCRRELGTRTIFNLLGPLSNPAGARRQLLGVFAGRWLEPMAQVLSMLGSERAWIVHGEDGLDELTTTARSRVLIMDRGRLSGFDVTPEGVGLGRASPADLRGGGAADNADALRRLLAGERGPYRDIVALNAAAALVLADRAATLRDGVAMACEAIDAGEAWARLETLRRITERDAA